MEIIKTKKKIPFGLRRKWVIDTDCDLNEKYPYSVTFYEQYPTDTISMAQFESYALERLKFLRIIERANMSSNAKYKGNWFSSIMRECKKLNLHQFQALISDSGTSEFSFEARHFDYISHYLLRLAFCRTEEQRRWFISLEVDFFYLKFLFGCIDRNGFLQHNGLKYEQLSPEEKSDLASMLCDSNGDANSLSTNYYKVPFTLALDLIRGRKTYLQNGIVFAKESDIVTIIASRFRNLLSQSLSVLKKQYYIVSQDERLMQILADFDKQHTGNDFLNVKKEHGITSDQFPKLAERSFPLCMKSLYQSLIRDHHLKHNSRLQLGLFFKGIGVSLDESIRFWRNEFTKRPDIDGARFDKQYLYGFRHQYGQEGSRKNYTPYSCMKIINSYIAPGDCHGCPFKHSDQNNLRFKLKESQISSEDVEDIVKISKQNQYQIACQKYFEITHQHMSVDGGINHPNQYFEESQSVILGKKTVKVENNIPTIKTSVYEKKNELSSEFLDAIEMEFSTAETEQDILEMDEEAQEIADLVNKVNDSLLR